MDLIKSRRTLGAVAPARSGMLGVAFELLHLASDFVDVGKQTTRRLAIEAGGWHQRIVTFLTPRPRLRIKLRPVIPAFLGWKRREMAARRAGIKGFILVVSARLRLICAVPN